MSAQKDFQAGLDFSGRPNISFAELIQAINGIAPLANIGGVIFGTATPDVVNNPRFERYLWLDDNTDPPVPKQYNVGAGTWDAVAVADASITAAKLAAHTAILDHFFNATAADATKANRILKFDSSGDLIEAVALATLLSANSVPLTALDKTGAADYQVIQYRTSDGLSSFRTLNGDAFAAGGIGLAKLAAGTNTHVLQMVAGVWASVAINTAIAAGDITLDKLGANTSGGTAAQAYQVGQRNAANTATQWTTPNFYRYSGVVFGAATLAVTGVAGLETIPHGLGAAPTFYKLYLRCLVNDNNWLAATPDDVPIEQFHEITTGCPPGASYIDATNIYFRFSDDVLRGLNRTTGAAFSVTLASWRMIAKAWL